MSQSCRPPSRRSGAPSAPRLCSRTRKSCAQFRDPFAYPTWDDYTAAAVVSPVTVEQVQEVVRIANGISPALDLGQGRNNGYGGPAPRVKGSVIVNLRNMNKVLEIDEECAYAVVEPGVRWFDLYDAIQAGGHKLWLSIADLGWGSVIGNTLDHGVTYLPYGADMSMQCGMEVVLPNGEVMRTGMGAMPGNRSWHVYKRGLGPTPDQLFMQSNFGIVTKMGIWLMPNRVLHAAAGCACGRRRPRPARRHAADAPARPTRSRVCPRSTTRSRSRRCCRVASSGITARIRSRTR